MESKDETIDAMYAFQVGRDDLGPLLVDGLRLDLDEYSPLAGMLRPYRPGSRAIDGNLRTLLEDAQVSRAASILARPTLRMFNQTGGGALPASFFTACHNADFDERAFVVINPSFEGSTLIQLFETPWDFLAWWLILNAGEATESSPNYMPPPIRLESLIYLLHAIDAYRRGAYQSMLNYTPTEKPTIRPKAFTDSMRQAVRSGDLRWLLPAFISLTPNLNTASLETSPEFIEALAKHDFLIPVRNRNSHEDEFLFGATGKIMGVEFFRTWMRAVGFETTVLTKQGWCVMHRGFLAPTGITNHLFLLDTDGEGRCTVNHQAMTRESLDGRLADLMTAALTIKKDAVPEGRFEVAASPKRSALRAPPMPRDAIFPPSPSATQISSDLTQWYYIQEGRRLGPVSESQIHRMLAAQMIGSDTYVWNETMRDWRKAGETGLTAAATLPPPAPDDAISSHGGKTFTGSAASCTACGAALKAGTSFCTKCGARA
ncbi:MAG: GYF domain-containing protein [Phycisphaerae bacterium]